MLVMGIDAHAVAHPDFVGLANLHVWVLLKECDLMRQFVWLPQIIRVKKRDQLSPSTRHSHIPCCRYATILLVYILNPGELLNDLSRSII